MSGEFLEQEGQEILENQEKMKEQELSETEKLKERSAAYWANYTEACGRGDKAAARYYLERYTQTRESLTEEKDENDLGVRLGSAEAEEAEEERKAREKVDAERERLERKLRTAEMNLKHAEKALEKLQPTTLTSLVSDREYQIKVYKKDIANIKRELANLKY